MKLTRDKYDLTIGEIALLFETNNAAILKRSKLVPGFVARRAFRRFIVEFAEMFNRQQVEQLVDNDIFMAKLRAKVSLFAALHQGLLNEVTFGVKNQAFHDAFHENFGKTFSGRDDLNMILKHIEKITALYRETATTQPAQQQGAKMSFSEVVATTEMMLERTLPRDLRLFEFTHEFNLAVARAKEYDKMRNKRNG